MNTDEKILIEIVETLYTMTMWNLFQVCKASLTLLLHFLFLALPFDS